MNKHRSFAWNRRRLVTAVLLLALATLAAIYAAEAWHNFNYSYGRNNP